MVGGGGLGILVCVGVGGVHVGRGCSLRGLTGAAGAALRSRGYRWSDGGIDKWETHGAVAGSLRMA
jgi:hypothetical protein